MTFSIILPIYNVEKYLSACIDSILTQTYKDYEIILVNDGSIDTSPQICDQYANQHVCIHVIHKPNGGQSDARNVGLKVARGEYIFFIDSDDYLIDNAIYVALLSIVFIYFYNQWFLASMVQALNEEHFEMYLTEKSGYSYVTFIFYTAITAMAYVGYRGYVKINTDDARLAFVFSAFACGLQLLAGVSAEMFRLAYLYSPFMMILLPNSCRFATPNIKRSLLWVLMGSLIFYFLYTNRNFPYSFDL
jgi:glycosyltransferase involved in cell wall biosynthesis